MARMMPPVVAADNPSNAEKQIFRIFKEGLPGEWTVLHSIGLAYHKRKRWAEADFVLVGPRGVFVGEVKGGRIRRTNRGWIFINRHGEENFKREGPYEQAGGCAAAINRYLREQLDDRIHVGWAVMFPDITWTVATPEAPPDLTYDARDVGKPILDFADRIADHWDRHEGEPQSLDQSQRDSIVHRLRPEFDLRPGLRLQTDRIEDELLALTEDQYKIVDGLADNPRVMVRGGAGTGKTLIALEEARLSARNGKKVLITCFTKALGKFIQNELPAENVTAISLHAYMEAIVRDEGVEVANRTEASTNDQMKLFLPEAAVKAIRGNEDLRGSFDVLIVDEAQDLLLNSYLDVFEELIAGGLAEGKWRLFFDPHQDMFNAMEGQAVKDLKDRADFMSYRLSQNCRNTGPIATFAAQVGGIKTDRILLDGLQVTDVEKSFCRNATDMKNKVSAHIKGLLDKGIKNEQIALLSPWVLENSCVADGLSDGLPRFVGLEDSPGSVDSILYATIGSFKGLERPFVVLVDVWDLGEPEQKKNLYVGASRARAQLTVFLGEHLRDSWEDAVQRHAERMFAED